MRGLFLLVFFLIHTMALFRYTVIDVERPDAYCDGHHQTTTYYSYADSADAIIDYWCRDCTSESFIDVTDITVVDSVPMGTSLCLIADT